MAGTRETSCFGAPKSTFRDRCKGSELFYFEVQFSWQVQHFGHGDDRRGAQISVTGAVKRTCVARLQTSWQVQHLVNLEGADLVAGLSAYRPHTHCLGSLAALLLLSFPCPILFFLSLLTGNTFFFLLTTVAVNFFD